MTKQHLRKPRRGDISKIDRDLSETTEYWFLPLADREPIFFETTCWLRVLAEFVTWSKEEVEWETSGNDYGTYVQLSVLSNYYGLAHSWTLDAWVIPPEVWVSHFPKQGKKAF